MTSKKELQEELRLARKEAENLRQGWRITSETFSEQSHHLHKLNKEMQKLRELVTKYRHLAEFNRANAGPAEYLVAHVNDEWVVLVAPRIVDYGITVLNTEAYSEYGKFPGFPEARDAATQLNKFSERKHNNR